MTLLDKQMDRFTKQSLNELVIDMKGPCISIYMPTERKGAETQQGPIRLKNLLTQVEAELVELGERTPDIQELLAPAHALISGNPFWQHQIDGLVILLARDMMATYRLPLSFTEMAVVNDRFYVKPLLPMLIGDGVFYLLTLTQGGVHLFFGSRFSLAEVELGDDVPKSLAEELRYDEFEPHLQSHSTGRQGVGGRGAAAFHGHGGAEEAGAKEHLLRFFRQLDTGVRDVIEGDERPPLLLAGVDALRGAYQQANQYNYLLESGIDSDPESLSKQELHARAWAIVEPIFAVEQEKALDAYHHLAGTGDERAATTVQQIVPAAYFQRVDTLFLPHSDTTIWGAFDPTENKVAMQAERQPGDEDLLDFAAVHTVLNGGTVYMVEPSVLPADAPLAAILRY